MKVSVEIEEMPVARLENYARVCGWALALAHAKSGDAATQAGYLGASSAFDEALADYAEAYADQVERDYAAFVKAVRAGKLKSAPASTRATACERRAAVMTWPAANRHAADHAL